MNLFTLIGACIRKTQTLEGRGGYSHPNFLYTHDLVKHAQKSQKYPLIFGFQLKIPECVVFWFQVFSCFGQYFCLHFEAFQLGMAPVYIAFLRFMGDDNEAKNYSYSLEVGGNGRKMIWQGVPRSIRDSHRKVRDSFDGLIIQRNMALFFSGGDRKELKLRVTGRIWKEQ